MRRNIKNIRHLFYTDEPFHFRKVGYGRHGSPRGEAPEKGASGSQTLKAYDIPWDGETFVRILARSKKEAEEIALNLVKQVAAKLIEGI